MSLTLNLTSLNSIVTVLKLRLKLINKQRKYSLIISIRIRLITNFIRTDYSIIIAKAFPTIKLKPNYIKRIKYKTRRCIELITLWISIIIPKLIRLVTAVSSRLSLKSSWIIILNNING